MSDCEHKLLESLNHAQKIAVMVKECNQASEELQVVVEKQEGSICNFRQTNDVITESADETAEGLNQYTGLMEQTEDGMKRIGETAHATEKSIGSLEEAMQEKWEKDFP